MGILNVTPDSFSDGGRFDTLDTALQQAHAMVRDGVDIIDVGGESTRPGAADVSDQQELDRVIPVIELLRRELSVPVSVDTSKAVVMKAAIRAGAVLINDVNALQAQDALATAVELQQPVCLMHRQGTPQDMQVEPRYDNVVNEVTEFLSVRMAECEKAGLGRDLLLVDPGFGFGKAAQHNIELLANLRQLRALGCPILVGLSRKATLGEITGRQVDERQAASVAAAVIAVQAGAEIVRAHDVRETVDAVKVVRVIRDSGENE